MIDSQCLVNLNARIYDPTIARFMTPDDVIPDQYNTQSLNRFTYVENGPLSYEDPTGHSIDDQYLTQKHPDNTITCETTSCSSPDVKPPTPIPNTPDPKSDDGSKSKAGPSDTSNPSNSPVGVFQGESMTAIGGYPQLAGGLFQKQYIYQDPVTGKRTPMTELQYRLCQAAGDCNVVVEDDVEPTSGETRDTANGKRVHAGPYRDALGPNWQYEYRLRSGRKVDAINFASREIRELKPNTRAQIRRGLDQLRDYKRELERETGQTWTTHLDMYTPRER